MSYREFLPSRKLAPFVSCFWSRDPATTGESRVLPDGAVDFLFDVDANCPDAAYVVGTMTCPLLVSTQSSYIAVRFRPAGVRAFLSLPVHDLTDRRVELACFLPEAREWLERLATAPGARERVKELDRLLRGALVTSRLPDPRVVAAVGKLERSGGTLDVASLSEELGLSRQHLRRLFEREVGVGVKMFSRVVRMQSVVARLERAPGRPDWAEVALDAGYFDQAHLVNDFRALTGLSPARHFARSNFPIPEGSELARVSP